MRGQSRCAADQGQAAGKQRTGRQDRAHGTDRAEGTDWPFPGIPMRQEPTDRVLTPPLLSTSTEELAVA